MKANRIIRIIGIVSTYLLSALLIISGLFKIIGYEPYQDMIIRLSPHYFGNIYLIGITAIFAGTLLAIPRTFTLGFITTLVFQGGTL